MNLDDEKTCKHVFDILDKNHDGTLDLSEFSKAVRALGLNPTNSDISDILKEHDIDQDGVINFKEFMHLARLVRIGNETSFDDILELYLKCYPDTDGFITAEELRKILTSQGEPLQEAEVDQIIDHFDPEKENRIHVETLIKGLLG